MNNPWLQLEQLSRIRVKESIKYDAFWIVDSYNRYGLMIKCDEDFDHTIREIKLNGIQIQLDQSSSPNKLILLLKETKDWEIFLILCHDLLNVMKHHDENIIISVMKRLERWQKLLRKSAFKIMSKEEQMGLFGELKILLDYIIPTYGTSTAINAWVGALGDKQDFLLENLAIEVKSFRMTSGNRVWISSKEQLNSEKNPLYLFACALIETDKGQNITDLVKSIIAKIENEIVLSEFIEKIEEYGYYPEIPKENLSKFILEKITSFQVKEEFPKIALEHISPLIPNIKYNIDLSGCSEFKVNINSILL
ncbi:PD-(D/E)XK motif protein [Bacillus yapensis]|nr:PD-(D/E)XK motif protein [Bacillus yapensis]